MHTSVISMSELHLSRAMATSTPVMRPPDLSNPGVAALVRELYPFTKVEEKSVKQFPSYDDRNFYFQGTLSDSFVPGCSERVEENKMGLEEFVLKINSTAFIPCKILDSLNNIMNHLKGKEVRCPYPLKSKNGKLLEICSESQLLRSEGSCESSGKEREFGVRVLIFLPGELLDKIDRVHVTPKLMFETGQYFGKLDAALQDFHHPATLNRELYWDLKHFLTLRSLLSSVKDSKNRSMAESVFQKFEEHVLPKFTSLRQGIIHGDANGENIIVVKENGCYKISGIIDFGDCVQTCYVFELAIMLAYAMVENENPLQLSCPMLSGYLQTFPMSEEELDCLYYCVLARLCQSAVVGEHKFKQEPWNTYLLTTPAKAWQVMGVIFATPRNEIEKLWARARQMQSESVH